MLTELIKMSNKYGAQSEFVLAGGGNTSAKDDNTLIVKASGYQLATIKEDGFVKLDRKKLNHMWHVTYSDQTSNREKEVLKDLMDARCEGEINRPSVETQLHDLFPFKFVLHLHPTKVNAVTCGLSGESWVENHLSHNVVWVEATKPGYILAITCKEKMEAHEKKHHVIPQILLLENHGVFFAADSIEEIDQLVDALMAKINQQIKSDIDLSKTSLDKAIFDIHLSAIKSLDVHKYVTFEKNHAIDDILENPSSYQKVRTSFTPDHVVYCRHEPLYTSFDNLQLTYQTYIDKFGFPPRIILLKGSGMYAVGDSQKQSENARLLFLDQIKIGYYSQYFGGSKPMTDDDINFILNWEVEHYRFKVQSK